MTHKKLAGIANIAYSTRLSIPSLGFVGLALYCADIFGFDLSLFNKKQEAFRELYYNKSIKY